MPAHRTPLAKAKLTGTAAHNPKRFKDRAEPKATGNPIGNPPAHLPKEGKAVWREAVKQIGWLTGEDRFCLEAMCMAIGNMRECAKLGEPVTAAMISAVNTSIAKLGANPTDRSRVFQKDDIDDAEEDPFAKFGKPN